MTSGVSKSTVSRICKGIDDEVAVFRTRPLDHLAMPYVYLDATYIKARNNHRIVVTRCRGRHCGDRRRQP